MDNVSFLIEKLYMEGWLRDEEFLEVLIHHGENEIRNLLAEYARKTAHRYYGNKVYTRGLIEFSNYCRNDCYYCGIRRSNSHAQRYRLKKEETGAYEERFLVSVDGEEAGNLYVQIPEKETGQTEEAQEEKISPEEERLREIQEAIAEYNQEKEDEDYYYLPEEWEGKHFIWEQKGDGSGTLMASLFLIAGAALMVLKSREEFALIQKKREQMLLDYPGLIMKFTLLVQAGMTARKAFQKIAGDYRKRKNKKERYAYEEILVVCYEMDSGVSEAEAYRRFGERCGQVKYKTFATLLIQNLQKGSRHLEDMLERESVEAWKEGNGCH